MRYSTIALMFLLFVNPAFSQNVNDFSYNLKESEEAHRILKHSTYKLLLSISSGVTGDVVYRAIGLNNNGTVRFNTIIDGTGAWSKKGAGYDAVCFEGPKKSTLIKYSYYICDEAIPPSIPYLFTYSCLIDSTGNIVFNKLGYDVTGMINDQFLFASNNDKMIKIDPLTGNATSTLIVESNDKFIATCVSNKKHILFNTYFGKLVLMDTLGVINNSIVITPTISAIKTNKNKFYLLEKNKSFIEQRDSDLTFIVSYSAPSGFKIADFTVFNDTVYVAINDGNQNLIKTFKTNSLTPLQTYTLNWPGKCLNALEKDSVFMIYVSEKRGKKYIYQGGISGTYFSSDIYNAGYFSKTNLQNISFTPDVILRSIKTQSIEVLPTQHTTMADIYAFNYQHSVVVKNNSPDTIKYFEISHALYTYTQRGFPCKDYNSGYYKNSYTLTIAPMDSIEILMPSFTGIGKFPITNSVVSIPFCYNVSLPNKKMESNVLNSENCLSYLAPVGLEESSLNKVKFELFPNPANDYITLTSKEPIDHYEITDICSRIIKQGKNQIIDLQAINAGVYFITIEIHGERLTQKFIKE